MTTTHNRKLGLCATALTAKRIPHYDIAVATLVRDEIEKVMIESRYLEGAPFVWITISLRYGLRNEDEPHYEAVNKQYGDLPLAIELDTNELATASRDDMKKAFEVATLKALVAAGRKYNLNFTALEARLEAHVT